MLPSLLPLLLGAALAAEPAWRREEVVIPPPSAPSPRAPGLRVSMELQEADIHAVLRFLAEVGDVNLVAGDEVKGTVTMRLRDVAWEDALAAVLVSKGLVAVPLGDTAWTVGPVRAAR